MKKVLAIVLSLVLAAALGVSALAEAKNYATKEWNADHFKGAIEKKDDGTVEYTLINNTWYGPSIDILEDLTTMLGDKEEIDVTFAFNVKVRFVEGEEDGETSFRPLVRADASDDKKELAKTPDDWTAAMEEFLDGDDGFITDISGNLYINGFPEGKVTCYDTDWTLYETTVTLNPKNISSDWFSSMYVTFDNISDYEILDAIIIKDFGMYVADEYEAAEPTAEATEAPEATEVPEATEAPEATDAPEATEAPEVTEAPAATDAPATDAPKATDAPAKKGCGSVLALGLLAAVIPAAIVARKKEN